MKGRFAINHLKSWFTSQIRRRVVTQPIQILAALVIGASVSVGGQADWLAILVACALLWHELIKRALPSLALCSGLLVCAAIAALHLTQASEVVFNIVVTVGLLVNMTAYWYDERRFTTCGHANTPAAGEEERSVASEEQELVYVIVPPNAATDSKRIVSK